MARRSNSLFALILVTLVCVGVGGFFTFYLGLPMYRRAVASQSWPTADGRIQTSRVETLRDNKGKTRYTSAVQFAYEVQGQNYESAYVWPSGGYSSSSQAPHQEVVDRYPPGKQVKVYYDPQKPQFGVLEPGVTSTNYVVLGVGGIFFLVGLVMTAATAFRFLFIARAIAAS